jgi:hypothetical protein
MMATDLKALPRHQTRLWLDLSEFSGKGRDCGVSASIKKWGYIPSAVAMLTTCPDFIHEHDGKIDDTRLRREFASYNGWDHSKQWTRAQYRTVVRALQSHGIKVFLCCMSTAYHPSFETFSDWAKEHRELLLMHNTGLYGFTYEGLFADMCYYQIAARFKDGRLYADFFADQVAKTVKDYGFDGFAAADGYKSTILGLSAAGYSPEMLAEFEYCSGIDLPKYRKDKPQQSIPPVAQWIWTNARQKWVDFWTDRFTSSWHTIGAKLRAAGKDLVMLSAWNTDPLESVSRYGMDTKALEEVSESMFFETHDIQVLTGPMSGPKSSRREGYLLEGNVYYACSLMSALLRAVHTPRMATYPMVHVHDIFERFEHIKGSRAYLEKTIIGYQQLYRIRQGKLEQATPGVWHAIPCLVSAEDWTFLRTTEQLGSAIRPAAVPGPVALWSSSTIDREMDSSRRKWPVHRTIYELAASGFPIITGVQAAEANELQGQCLLWANPQSFAPDEQEAIYTTVAAGRNRLIAFDSKDAFTIPKGVHALEIRDGHSKARLAITGTKAEIAGWLKWIKREAQLMTNVGELRDFQVSGQVVTITAARKAMPYEYDETMESHFMTRLPPYRLARPYLDLCGGLCRLVAWPTIQDVRIQVGPRQGELAGHDNQVFYIENAKGEMFIIAKNLHCYASYLEVTLSSPIKNSKPLNSVVYHPEPIGTKMEIMIPAWGITVYKVEL